MPKPVLALPWGSRSITRTRCLVAARAVARLIAVVVLPTPPFWLATAMTRGRRPSTGAGARSTTASADWGIGSGGPQVFDAHDDAFGVGGARLAAHIHCPGFARERQFASPVAALVEQADRGRPGKPRRVGQQPGQRRQRAGGHDPGD